MSRHNGSKADKANALSAVFSVKRWLQVQQSRLVEGEERRLRATLKQLESRRSTVERAGLVHLAVMGEEGVGGVMQGLRALEGHANAILDQEEAHSLSLEGKSVRLVVHVICPLQRSVDDA